MLGLSIGDSFAAHRHTIAVAKGHAAPAAHAQASREDVRGSSPHKRRSASVVSSASSDSDLAPALMPSLFPNVPPTINFVHEGDKGE